MRYFHKTTHTHTHTHLSGALFDGKDLSNTKALRKTFNQIDEDKSGELDADEILACLKSMGAHSVSKEEVVNMMKIADTDGGGTVDFDEFVTMLKNIKAKSDLRAAEKKWISVFSSLDFKNAEKKVLRRAFNDLDVDGGGNLDKAEIKPLL